MNFGGKQKDGLHKNNSRMPNRCNDRQALFFSSEAAVYLLRVNLPEQKIRKADGSLRKYVSGLIGIIKDSLPSTSGEYKSFYRHCEKNGL